MKKQLENYLYSEIDSRFSQRTDLEIEEVEEISLRKMKIGNKELLYKETNEQEISEFKDIERKVLANCKEVEKGIVAINKKIEDARELLSYLGIEEDTDEIRSLSLDPLEELINHLEYVTWEVEKTKTESYVFTGSGTVEVTLEYLDMQEDYCMLGLNIDFNYTFEEMNSKEVRIREVEITNHVIK